MPTRLSPRRIAGMVARIPMTAALESITSAPSTDQVLRK